MIEVVAGLVIFQSSILVAKRKAGLGDSKNLWEFPGGKVESGESLEQALARELWEELRIVTTKTSSLFVHDFKNSQLQQIRLHLLATFAQDLNFQRLDHDEVLWIKMQDLEQVDLLDSNKVFVGPIQQWLKSRGFL